MRAPFRRVVTLLVTAALGAALAGCGVPGTTSERVPSSEVPPGLLDPAPPGGPAGPDKPEETADGGATTELLATRAPSAYLIDADDALVAVPLQSPQTTAGPASAPPTAAAVGDEETAALVRVLLRRLNRGPTPDQRDQGLSTALGAGVPARLVDVAGGTARVELRQPDRDPPADRLPLVAGQVVLTVTSAPGVVRVQVVRDDAPTAVTLPGGARWEGPVTALDYAVLLAARRAG